MPSKIRDKEKERDADSPRSKDRPRHKSIRSSRKEVDKTSPTLERSSTTDSPTTKRRSSVPIPEVDRRTESNSPLGSKTSLPYPSFSKAHSKEAVGSRENVVNPRLSYYTPDPTDIERGKDGAGDEVQDAAGVAPPSPPETTMDQKLKMDKPKADTVKVERKRNDLQKAADELKRRLGRSSSSTSQVGKDRSHVGKDRDDGSQTSRSRTSHKGSTTDGTNSSTRDGAKLSSSAKNSNSSTPSKLKAKAATVEDSASSTSFRKASSSVRSSATKSETPTRSSIDSNATTIAPGQAISQRPHTPHADRASSPTSALTSSPRTPTPTDPQIPPSGKQTPAYSINAGRSTAGPFEDSLMPPPPPPPPAELPMPKVDYLMQNGGLPQPTPRSLLLAGQPLQASQPAPTVPVQVEKFFSPFNRVLDDYNKVISRSGSLAVATGYRSVARRLLDRLEAVFARDISSETCTCNLCQSSPEFEHLVDDKQGVSWGEILEYVCGRQALPQWPAFTLATSIGLGISASDNAPPMQKLDIDVPHEFRDHYVRQSKKTKQSVDKWLESQPANPSSPPQDVDDETLTFAILTRLEPEQRPIFSSLLGVLPSRPASTVSASGLSTPASSLLSKTGLAIQRLYRLPDSPRDPESAIYLLTNPHLHNVLATLAAISDGEWEILTSGRFDGFLRSGAEDTPAPPSRGPTPLTTQQQRTTAPSIAPFSRGPTPISRQPTPASHGAPVALDEETEIAVLAEVEREIYIGMEALEDAFEALHGKAESVRRTLRERGAGLAQAGQRRKGLGSTNLDARLGTPASGLGAEWDGSETDDGSELCPDDSASNVSRSRRRRPRRRNERRTPALVEEMDEGEEGEW